MNEVFGAIYAAVYDMLYDDKNYAAECDLIERIFQTYRDGPICSVLDLGCGTGNHAIPLARRGYEVVGVDRSADMLVQARKKVANLVDSSSVAFHQGDVRSIDLQRHFDAALMMFAVLGYQLGNADVLSALRIARRHLRSGGLLIFDAWYGPAVLHQRPSQRIKVIPTPEGQLLRVASGELDTRRHICTVRFHVWQLKRGQLVSETEESHQVRYFFPLELELLLKFSDFALIQTGAFPELERGPDETTWNVLVVARAVGGVPEQVKGLAITARSMEHPSYDPAEATGVLVPPGDAEAMGEATGMLLSNEALRQRLCQNAARDAQARFSLERQADEYSRWYHQIVSSRKWGLQT